ncbi:MAG: hypothetical protein KIT43_09625 [Bauldia sp.]|nr:hypothetical protein [Bauldia sp.]MCW5718520.1 hypothetical protein [Bauldia sp.]
MNGRQSNDSGWTERAELGFREAALDAFGFLADFGFAVEESTTTIVRYERPGSGVNIYHGRRSFELGFELGHDGSLYTISALMALGAPEEGKAYRNFAATTASGVRTGLEHLAELVQRHGALALQGDPQTFRALEDLKRASAHAMARESVLTSVRPKADEAFRLGHYAEAADLYDRIRDGLSPVETRKADLARRRSAGASRAR